MSSLVVDGINPDLSGGNLLRFQRDVSRIVVKLVVKDDDGEQICNLTSGLNEGGVDGLKSLLSGFVKEWAALHDALVARIAGSYFGQLSDDDITKMDVVLGIGAMLLSTLKDIHRGNGNHCDISDHILDLTGSLRALSFIQSSYESNPSNKDLDSISAAA